MVKPLHDDPSPRTGSLPDSLGVGGVEAQIQVALRGAMLNTSQLHGES